MPVDKNDSTSGTCSLLLAVSARPSAFTGTFTFLNGDSKSIGSQRLVGRLLALDAWVMTTRLLMTIMMMTVVVTMRKKRIAAAAAAN